jgi:hypothetical protein
MKDCRLCGRKNTQGAGKKEPCSICKETYPTFRRCRSCCRIFPDGTYFACEKSDRCTSCEKRRKQRLSEVGETSLNDVESPSTEASAVVHAATDVIPHAAAVTDVPHQSHVNSTGRVKKTSVAKKPRKVTKYLHLSIDDVLVGKVKLL